MPPSANRYWRVFRGRPVVSEEATAYKRQVRWLALQQLRQRPLRPLSGPVSLSVVACKLRGNADLSNRIKVLEDALQGVAFEDDKQVVELHAYRAEGDEAKVVVTVEAR